MEMTLNEKIEYLQSGNWYDKVRAVLPTDEYLKLGWAIGDILETLKLLRSLAPEPETNADRIRAMSDEELAELLAEEQFRIANAVFQTVGYGLEKQAIYARRLDWLQQLYEGE